MVDPLLVALARTVETTGRRVPVTVVTPGGVIRGVALPMRDWAGLVAHAREEEIAHALQSTPPDTYLFMERLRLPDGDASANWLRVPLEAVTAFWFGK